MTTHTGTYRNNYFNFYINFSGGWRFRNGAQTSNINYQQGEDDIPKEDGGYKTILFAGYKPKTAMTSKCNFSISVHKKRDYFDLLEFSNEKTDVVNRQYSHKIFLGYNSQEVIIKQIYSDSEMITKVIIWNVSPEIWISAVAEGSSSSNFDMAEGLFSQIHRIR